MKRQFLTKTFALTCLFSLLTEVIYPSVVSIGYNKTIHLSSTSSSSGSAPVADAANDMVDLYTGDFRYGVPLMSVPGPNGEDVDITLSYHGGIRMDEKSSWIGLGWDYNPGEISRNVVGVADDYAGQPVYSSTIGLSGEGVNTSKLMYGPFHYDKMGSATLYPYGAVGSSNYEEMTDATCFENPIKETSYSYVVTHVNSFSTWPPSSNLPPEWFPKPTAVAQMPAYDQYNVSGPGIGGQLKPFIFKGAALLKPRAPGNNYYPSKNKTQFYFDNSTFKKVTGVNPDGTNNRIRSGYFVKYYLNSEINNTSNIFNNTTQVGFLDYKPVTSSTPRPSSTYDQNGIGAIEITDPTGITYHYSLPVYTKEEMGKTFLYSSGNENDIDLTASNVNRFQFYYKKFPYATSWKLTAVTGPDYQDVNGNKTVDEGDNGYWIAYNYSLWNYNHLWTTHVFNARDGKIRQADYGGRLFGYNNYTAPSFSKTYNVGQGQSEIYYLNYIRTATHTAYFIKDQKLDDHSYDNLMFSPSKPNALLKLSRILLMRNEDKNLILNSSGWNMSNVDSRFNTGLFSSPLDPNLVHINKYSTNKAQIDAKSLKSVELKTDYSLCKKLYNNINNSISSSSYTKVHFTPLATYNSGSDIGYIFYNKASGYSTTDANNSGKLTLNEIVSYEDGGIKMFPSYIFDYDKTSSSKNPDYDPERVDLWGYYKSDYVWQGGSHYTTPTSSADMDAWSLKEITTPVGQKIAIEYEPDEYEQEGYADDPWTTFILPMSANPDNNKPTIIYPLNTFAWSTSSSADQATFNYNDLSAVSGGNSSNELMRFMVVPREEFCSVWKNSTMSTTSNYVTAYYKGSPGWGTISTSGINTVFEVILTKKNWTSPGNGYMVPGFEEVPDLNVECDLSLGYSNRYGYNKKNASGYVLYSYKKLYGGGVRVKNIKFTDPDNSSEYYKQNYTYTGGYCPVVPKEFMMGPQNYLTEYLLWDNLKLIFSENGGSQVGYGKVTVRSIDKYNADNGATEYYFQNDPIVNPVQTAATYSGPFTNSPSNCYPLCTSGGSVSKYCIYTITSEFKNDGVKMLGKLNKIISNNVSIEYIYDPGNGIWTEKFIKESYDNDMKYYRSIPKSTSCTSGSGTVTQYCTDNETYNFNFSYYNYTPALIKTTKTVDGITSSSAIFYHPDTKGTRVNLDYSPSTLYLKTSNSFAYATIPALGRKDSAEVCKNQLLLPSKTRTVRSIDQVDKAYTDGYLLSENDITYSNAFLFRNYNNTTSQYESVSQTKGWYTRYETSERLVDDKTIGSSTSAGTFRRTSQSILFNGRYNTLIEEGGLNDRLTSVKLGYNNLFKLASISNANYNSFTFSSYEDTITVATGVKHFGGEITGGQFRAPAEYAQYTTTSLGPVAVPGTYVTPHTGYYTAKVPPNTYGPTFTAQNLEINRTYRAQVWVHKQSPNDAKLVLHLQGTDLSNAAVNLYTDIQKNDASNVTVGDWTLMTIQIPVPANLDLTKTHSLSAYVRNINSTTNAYYDDFMLHPVDAPITGNVYDLRTGRLIATLDEENYATKYNYDPAGRVVSVYKETKTNGLVKILEKGYHNSRP